MLRQLVDLGMNCMLIHIEMFSCYFLIISRLRTLERTQRRSGGIGYVLAAFWINGTQ